MRAIFGSTPLRKLWMTPFIRMMLNKLDGEGTWEFDLDAVLMMALEAFARVQEPQLRACPAPPRPCARASGRPPHAPTHRPRVPLAVCRRAH